MDLKHILEHSRELKPTGALTFVGPLQGDAVQGSGEAVMGAWNRLNPARNLPLLVWVNSSGSRDLDLKAGWRRGSKVNLSKFFVCLLIALFAFDLKLAEKAYAISARAKVTLKVIDEEGVPIKGANVGVAFQYDKTWETGVTGKDGLSDDEGKFTASGNCNGHISYGADMEGYYKSHYTYDFNEKGLIGWQPWNLELEIVLRKIQNPVPMYARYTKQSEILIPIEDKEVGFDLIAFDWVIPYGRGTVADFIFLLKKDRKGPKDFSYELELTFSNAFDGIQVVEEDIRNGSQFILPRYAPINGYNNEIAAFIKRTPEKVGGFSWKDNRHYVFRVRSEEENGKLKRAMYGKILEDIRIRTKHPGTAFIEFKYYLNPDYTRNLEFDPKHNLFTNLPDREQVGIR